MPYKTELQFLSAGESFYFANDPELTVWKKSKEKRRTEAKQIFFYCENTAGVVEDFAANRFVMAFSFSEKETPTPPEYEKESPVYIYSDTMPNKYSSLKTISNIMQQHNISTRVSVLETSNYKMFKKITGNREINTAKVKRIIKEINAGNDMLEYYPILVQEAGDLLNVLDGQHRLEISKILKRPVYYILVKEQKEMAEIAKVNSNVEKWKAGNYINCYVKAGNDNYLKLHDFITTYGFSVGVCLSLLDCGTPGKINGEAKHLQRNFEHGIFEVKEYEAAVAFADMCSQFNFFANWRSRDFVIAIYRIHTAALYNFSDIVAAVSKNANILTQQATHKEYIFKIEQIVNMGKKIRVIIA